MSKHPRRKKSFILIEVLISTSLFVMLLAAIFGIFWRTSKTSAALNRLRIANEQVLVAQARLQTLFSKLSFMKTPKPYFFTERDKNSGLRLVFTIELPVETDCAFSVDGLVKLYVEDNQLVVATFPYFEQEKGIPNMMQKEALLSNVTDFRIFCFLAPESQEEPAKSEEETAKKPPEASWIDVWPIEYDRQPTLVKLEIERGKGNTYDLWFFVPRNVKTILYDKS